MSDLAERFADQGGQIVVGYSGGITSARCAQWALDNFPRERVTLLFHDTKEEDEDTYRFMREVAAKLDMPITEQSDGRSVSEVFDDEGAIANNRMAFCSRILKAEQRDIYFERLKRDSWEPVVNVLGLTKVEWQRVQRTAVRAERAGYICRYPCIEEGWTKQDCIDWSVNELGVRPPRIYEWSEHANCVGCVRGGRAYWKAVDANAPEVYEKRMAQEDEFGFTIINGISLRELRNTPLKRVVNWREKFEVPCECIG